MNVVHYGCLNALDRGDALVDEATLEAGIRKELSKEGKLR
jgi:hypothetical protein